MDVILLEKIDRLGGLGDKVSVKSGFARNFLLPQGKAKPATAANLAEFEARRSELEAAAAESLAKAKARAEQLSEVEVSITAKAGTEGKLFGSIGPLDIAEAVTSAGMELARSEVRMPNGPLRAAGEYEVHLHLHSDVDLQLSVLVVADEEE